MKKKLWMTLILLVAIVQIGCTPSTKTDNNTSKVKKSVEKENQTDTYEEYLQTELIPQYGISAAQQKGFLSQDIILNAKSNWLNPEGIFTADISDWNDDGEDELLLIRFEEYDRASYDNNVIYYQMILSYYSYDKNHQIKKTDETVAKMKTPDTKEFLATLSSNISVQESVYLTQVKDTSFGTGLFIQMYCSGGLFSDGQSVDYLVFAIKNNKIQPEAGFLQTDGGSTGFEYSGLLFKDNEIISSETLYKEDDYDYNESDKYFIKAVTDFFAKSNIQIHVSQNNVFDVREDIMKNNENSKKISSFHVTCDAGNQENNYFFERKDDIGLINTQ